MLAAELGRAERTTIVILDATAQTLHDAPALRALLGAPERGVAAVVLAASVDDLPASCTTVVRPDEQ